MGAIYEVCKLSNETRNVAFDMATVEARGMKERQVDLR